MNAISQGTHSTTYGYEPNSSLVKTINHAQNSVNRLTETRVYDNLNRLRSITNLSSAASDAVAKSFTYTYNNANQRTSVNREDNTRWEYGYDALGHVTSAVKKLPDNAPLAGHQFGYSYDALGNRIAATFGGGLFGSWFLPCATVSSFMRQWASIAIHSFPASVSFFMRQRVTNRSLNIFIDNGLG